jgi:hypothetical protein
VIPINAVFCFMKEHPSYRMTSDLRVGDGLPSAGTVAPIDLLGDWQMALEIKPRSR